MFATGPTSEQRSGRCGCCCCCGRSCCCCWGGLCLEFDPGGVSVWVVGVALYVYRAVDSALQLQNGFTQVFRDPEKRVLFGKALKSSFLRTCLWNSGIGKVFFFITFVLSVKPVGSPQCDGQEGRVGYRDFSAKVIDNNIFFCCNVIL